MPRYISPSELKKCSRCGLRREVNIGKKRKAHGTNLCRDCWMSTDWQCPVCLKVFSMNYRISHIRSCN